MSTWRDRVVVVTGAASGIGKGLAESLAAKGARVVVSDRNAEGAEQVARALDAWACPADVAREDEVEHLFEETCKRHGRLDYAFNNAGVGCLGEVRDMTSDHFSRVLDINLMGVIRCALAAYRSMLVRGSGHIVNTASLAGLCGSPGMVPYSTSKAAVVRFSLDLGCEARSHGIKVSVLCPGFIQSGIYTAAEAVKVNLRKATQNLPVPIAPIRPAVEALLRGVERNQSVITYPKYARLMWWISRLHRHLLDPVGERILKNIQASREGP